MPLFKGKSSKAKPTKAINYIVNKAELVSSLFLNDDQDYAKQFMQTAERFGKCKTYRERKYYHFKLSCSQSDNVSLKAHHEYAEAMAKRLFKNNECIIATHTDTDTIHSHIIVNSVSFNNGKKLHISDSQYATMKDIANELGKERGFSELDFRTPAKDRVTTQERNLILKGGTSWKEELREVIKLAKQDCLSMQDFANYLQEYGITLPRNTKKTISFKHPLRSQSIRGEKLGAEYTKGAIENELAKNKQRSDSERGITAASRTEQARNRKHSSESRISGVERKLRGIDEAVNSRTSQGRAEQAERRRAEQAAHQRAEAERRKVEDLQQYAKKRNQERFRGLGR